MEKELLKHYSKEGDGTYLLEFKIDSETDYFDQYDPFPHHERDLNPRLAEQIIKQIIIFPKKEKVKIVFHCPKKMKKNGMSNKIISAFKHHFEFNYLDSHIHLKRRIEKGKKTLILALLIFILLIGISAIIRNFFAHVVLSEILSEGLFVGAWVTLWHPMQILLYDWLPLKEEKEKFQKIIDSGVEVSYR